MEIESTDSAYEGENPAFFRRQWRKDKKWAEMRLKWRRYKLGKNDAHILRDRFLSEIGKVDKDLLKDTPDPQDPDMPFFDYILYRRGSRGKMAVKNEDIFIIWG